MRNPYVKNEWCTVWRLTELKKKKEICTSKCKRVEWFCASCPHPQFSEENITLRAQGCPSFRLLSTRWPVVTQGSGLKAHGPAAFCQQRVKLFLSTSKTVALISHKSSQTWFKWIHYSRLIIFFIQMFIFHLPWTMNWEKPGISSEAFPRTITFWNNTFCTNWAMRQWLWRESGWDRQGVVFFKSRICLIR